MKKIIITLFLGLFPFMGYSQEFLHNPDYVYGSGQTDSAAIASLSISIGVKVTSESSYTIEEKDNRITRDFNKTTGVSYSKLLKNTKPYYKDGTYYRYLNKREYTDKCLNLSQKYLNYAFALDTMAVKHKINLILGYYYKAYCAIDDIVFEMLTDNEHNSLKANIKYLAESTYYSGDYGSLFICNEVEGGGYKVATNSAKKSVGENPCLFAFEYLTDRGWKYPTNFETYNEEETYVYSIPTDNKFFDKCFVDSKSSYFYYRIIYEDENGRIDVPINWYFSHVFHPVNGKKES